MKKCPFCAEEIQDEAIKCRHCNEFLEKPPQTQWFFKPTYMVVTFLCVGPLMLPMVWWHPTFSRKKKIVISVIVLFISYLAVQACVNAVSTIRSAYEPMMEYFK